MYIYNKSTEFKVSYGYPMVILWLSYGAGVTGNAQCKVNDSVWF